MCAPVLNYIQRSDQTTRFNAMERAFQMAALLIREEEGSHARLDAFLASQLEWQQRALYQSAFGEENVAILYRENKLGFIAEFVTYRAGLGYRQVLNAAPPGQVIAAGPGGQGGRYDQAYLERKMQAEDLKNATSILQREVLSAETLDKFEEWKEDILKAVQTVDLYGRSHWSVINRLIKTRVDHNIHQVVTDLFPQNSEDMARLDPEVLLTQLEGRLITEDQMEYKRLMFEVAKQKESENLWEFENRLHFLQKQAKITDETCFVETYKKGVFNNKLREIPRSPRGRT